MSNPIPCASLYVGDLHPDVTEAILYDKFQTHGNVLSIRVCRDLVTRKSLGYAYVNYQTPSEAKVAMDHVNFEEIMGRNCRIMWSQRDPASRRSGVGNIFIKNLDGSITSKEIHDTFANFGDITSCKLQTDETGNSKGFAFVNFAKEEDAEKAIQAINGKMIRNKLVYVAKFIPRSQRLTQVKDYTNCYIKNFGSSLTDKTLEELFSKYGTIVSAKVMVDKENQPKGFGFVSFEDHESAAKATEELNGFVIDEKPLFVGRAMKKGERSKELKMKFDKLRQERMTQHKSGVNLYIKNLSNEIDDSRLKAEFVSYGNITSAKVMLNKENNTSKGFGFVCFSAPDEATRAVSEMNGKIVEGKPLYVALAQKKEDRMAHLRTQFAQRMTQPQTMLNQNMISMMMNNAQNAQRGIYPQRFNMPAQRWPPAPMQYMTAGPQRGIVNFPPGAGGQAANAVMLQTQAANLQQSQRRAQPEAMMVGRSARPITGNVGGMAQTAPRAQYNAVANPGVRYMPGAEGTTMQQMQHPLGVQANQQPIATMNVPTAPQATASGTIKPVENATGTASSQIDPSIATQIANADSVEAKQMLGEKIYPIVAKFAREEAGKITGMFLELDNSELLYMIEQEDQLKKKVDEALVVLKTHSTTSTTTASNEDQA